MGIAHRGAVRGNEGLCGPVLPRVRPRLEIAVVGRRVHGESEERRIRRVAERSRHARDILERRVLRAPLRERASWLALEIENDEILFDAQHLSEVIVAMYTRCESRGIDAAKAVECIEEYGPQREDRFGLRPRR